MENKKPVDARAELLEANQQLVLATLRAQAAEEQLREEARYKDEFLAMLGHELRNPLVPIRNAAEVLQHVDSSDKRVAWVREVLVRQVGHITRLVDDLLDISLISRGAMQLRFEPVDLKLVIQRAIESVEPLVQRRHHRLRCALPSEPAWVDGDAIRLGQVFENLLTNAAKYTQDGGEISIGLVVDGDVAVVRLRDNGLGMSADILPRIFGLFVQDARAADRSQGGLGIGLALVRHLVELHRGTIDVSSAGVDQGSEFAVRLPLRSQAALSVPAASEPDRAASIWGRVLVVDDDVDAGDSMALLLEVYGYVVQRATDVHTALSLAPAFKPQVVLMDISMPEVDGYEVARRMRALPEVGSDVTYIAVTGFGQPGSFQRSVDAGFAHHMVKPVDPQELDRILRQALQAP